MEYDGRNYGPESSSRPLTPATKSQLNDKQTRKLHENVMEAPKKKKKKEQCVLVVCMARLIHVPVRTYARTPDKPGFEGTIEAAICHTVL